MRYYSIQISDPNTGESIVPDGNLGFARAPLNTNSNVQPATFTSWVNGATDPSALNIEFDFIGYPLGQLQAQSRLKIWGIGLKMIGQAANLNGMSITMRAGMAPGLPLANPAQAGVVLQGYIFQAYGNWEGVNQTLDLIVNPGKSASVFEIGFPFFWQAGTSLQDAIDAALSIAYPQFKRQIYIDSNLTLTNDESGWYQNFAQFASYLHGLTLKIGSDTIQNYPGVWIVASGDTLNVFDGSSGGPPSILKQLQFPDLIGQPTWLSGTEISFGTVLRADISVGNRVKFPSGILAPYAITSPAAGAMPNVPARSASVFQGDFLVKEVHHFGNFREPEADAWQTAFRAVAPPVSLAS